ncbi:cytochrome c oxidase subunit 3 [Tanacetum coccineum]
MIESQRHSYHLVDPSPWPISGSLGALATTVGGVMYMHSFQGGATLLSLGLIFILYTMFVWWRDVLRESTLEGHHTKVVQLGPRYGFILFIVSEVMFLFALFRASSHSSLAPTVEIGGIWPPKGIAVLDPREIPFLNTLIPLSSGAAVTWAHHAILAGKEKRAVYALVATVSLALVFTAFQGMEYYQAPSTISDSIYGSTFFLATGFHGFHVIIGTLFSIICGIRQYLGHLTKEHHVGFEAAAWDRRDYGRSCSPRNDPKLDLGLFEIVPFNRNQRCFLVSRFFSEQIEEPNGSNSSLAATKEIGLALRKERSALSQFLYDVDEGLMFTIIILAKLGKYESTFIPQAVDCVSRKCIRQISFLYLEHLQQTVASLIRSHFSIRALMKMNIEKALERFLKGVALGSALANVVAWLVYSEIGTDVLRTLCKVMVPALGRLEDAFDFVNKMEFEPNEFIWSLLTAGCRSYGNLELGFYAAE